MTITVDDLRTAVQLQDLVYGNEGADGVSHFCDDFGVEEGGLAHVAMQRGMGGVAHHLGIELNEQSAHAMMGGNPALLALAAGCWIDGYTAATLAAKLLSKGSQA